MSGSFIAAARSAWSVKVASAGAGSILVATGDVSNASPPAINATSDSVRTSTPFAPSETSMPLAFQKRVPELTYCS